MSHKDPVIVTDDHLPCVVFGGKLSNTKHVADILEKMSGELDAVDNVYNCRAFAIDDKCTNIIVVKKGGDVFLVVFVDDEMEIHDDNKLAAIQIDVREAEKLINRYARPFCDTRFGFEKYWLERQGRRRTRRGRLREFIKITPSFGFRQ